MSSNSSPSAVAPEEAAKSPAARRLIAAAMLIGLAIGALALVDRLRERPAGLAPPHEPSQALITTPPPEPSASASGAEQPARTPPPPLVLNNETLAPSRHTVDAPPPSLPVTSAAPVESSALVPGKAYMIQVGVFSSPANAQALQKQLQHAGMEARLETRVQLGPFRDRRDADKALARAKKLGINAVIVSAR